MKTLSTRWWIAFLPVILHTQGVEAATISFATRTGMTYVLEESYDLQQWIGASDLIIGDGTRSEVFVQSVPSCSFYRLRIECPFTFDRLSFNTEADLDDLRETFSTANWKETAKEVLRRSVADAGWIVDNDSDPNFFFVWFGGDPADFTQMVFRLSSAAHETIHHVGFSHISFQNGQFVHALAMGKDAFFSTPAMNLFPRSEILNWLPEDMQTSGYANAYLTGQSGGQDIVNLLDEFNAYVFTTLIDTAVVRYMTGLSSSSSRDGTLAMMLFTEGYLKVAREQHPVDYERILSSPLGELIVILWDRAERTLRLSEGDPRLGWQDQAIRAHVYDQEWLSEIQRVRAAVLPKVNLNR